MKNPKKTIPTKKEFYQSKKIISVTTIGALSIVLSGSPSIKDSVSIEKYSERTPVSLADSTKIPGNVKYQSVALNDTGQTSVITDSTKTISDSTYFGQKYPNPFMPSTTFHYTLGKDLNAPYHVEISISDVSGKEVYSVSKEYPEPGTYNFNFPVDSSTVSGVYIVQLRINNKKTIKQKMMIVK